jgi:hypothetical protein
VHTHMRALNSASKLFSKRKLYKLTVLKKKTLAVDLYLSPGDADVLDEMMSLSCAFLVGELTR